MPNKYYRCGCGHEFKQFVTYVTGNIDPMRGNKGKKQALSTQVKCPKCLNFIPTWKVTYVDGKKIRLENRG